MRFRYFLPDGDFFLRISSHLLTFNQPMMPCRGAETQPEAEVPTEIPMKDAGARGEWSQDLHTKKNRQETREDTSEYEYSFKTKVSFTDLWVTWSKSEFSKFQLSKSLELCCNVESCHGKKGCHAGNCKIFGNECWNMRNSVMANGCLAIELPSPN